MGKITVVGVGKKQYPINKIKVNMTVLIKDQDYQTMLKREQETVAYLKDAFKSDLKTITYQVNQHREYNENEVVWTGYQFRHKLRLTIDNDLNRLGEVLETITQSPTPVEFSLSYFNDEVDEDELRELAVKDAMHKAQVMAKAAGVELQKIKSLSSDVAHTFEVTHYNKTAFDFEDVEESVTVTMEWEI